MLLNSDGSWTYNEGQANYDNPCNPGGSPITRAGQVLASGTWESDGDLLKLTLISYDYFPLLPLGAGPGTVITIASTQFNRAKTLLTGEVKDFSVLRAYVRGAVGGDALQLCKQRFGTASPVRLGKPEDSRDEGAGLLRLSKQPSPEAALTGATIRGTTWKLVSLADQDDTPLGDLPGFIADNELSFRLEGNEWEYIEKGKPYDPCESGKGTKVNQLLVRGTWQLDTLSQTLTLSVGAQNIGDYHYLAPFGCGETQRLVITAIDLSAKGIIMGKIKRFFVPADFKSGASDQSSLCAAGNPVDINALEHLTDRLSPGQQLPIGLRKASFDDEEDAIVTPADLQGKSFVVKGYTAGAAFDPQSSALEDKLPAFARGNKLTFTSDSTWTYVQGTPVYQPCGPDQALTTFGEVLAKGSWKLEGGKLTLTPDQAYEYFAYTLIPFAAHVTDQVVIDELKQITRDGNEHITGRIEHFFAPSLYVKQGDEAQLCQASKPVDLKNPDNLTDKVSTGQSSGIKLEQTTAYTPGQQSDLVVKESDLANASWVISGLTPGHRYDSSQTDVYTAKQVPDFMRDNALNLLADRTWQYIETGIHYSPCPVNAAQQVQPNDILAQGTWSFQPATKVGAGGTLTLTIEEEHHWYAYLLPYSTSMSKATKIVITGVRKYIDANRKPTADIIGNLEHFFIPVPYDAKKGKASLCVSGKPVNLKTAQAKDMVTSPGDGAYFKKGALLQGKKPIVDEAQLKQTSWKITGYTPGATYDGNNDQLDQYWPDFVRDNVLTLKQDHSWVYLEKGKTYQNTCKAKDFFKAITKADQILAKGTWRFDALKKKLTLIPDPNYEPYFYSLMPYGRNAGETVVLSDLEKDSDRSDDRLFARVDHFFAIAGYSKSDPEICSKKYGPLLLSGSDVEDKETGRGGILLQKVTYDTQGQEPDYKIKQTELINSSWFAKAFHLSSGDLPLNYWENDSNRSESQSGLPDFVFGNIIKLKQDGSELKWEYNEGGNSYITDCAGLGGEPNTSRNEKLIGGTWSFDPSKQVLTLSMKKESGTNCDYCYILPYAAKIKDGGKIVIKIKKSPNKTNLVGELSHFYIVGKGYDKNTSDTNDFFCRHDETTRPLDEYTEDKGRVFIYLLNRP